MRNREDTLKQIQIDYINEFNEFITDNILLDEYYFIEYKLKGLNMVIQGFEDVGGFYYGNDEFEYGEKASNRNLFGYYYLYSKFLISKKSETNKLTTPNVEKIDLEGIFKFIKAFEKENPYKIIAKGKDKKLNANFIVGMKFATGEVYKFLECNKNGHYIVKDKLTFDDITEKLSLKISLRPFISDTVSKAKRLGSKNIYANNKVMLLIKEHCIENEIEMCTEFIQELEKIQEN